MDLLYIIPAFLVTIGILVTVHEFGHYWVARKLGIKVLRFSIGFGKSLWSKRAGPDNTEYVLAALPLGGYVQMLDEREGDVPEHEKHRAFNTQPVWKRFAVVFAGPAFNFMLAVIIYMLMYGIGVPAGKALVYAQADSVAAQAGIQPGDKITAINDTAVASLKEARMLLLEEYLKTTSLRMTVETQQGNTQERVLDLSGQKLLAEESDYFYDLGFRAWSPEMHIMLPRVMEGSPAEAAKIEAGDRVLAVNGQAMLNGTDFVSAIKQSEGQTIALQIQRDAQVLDLQLTPREAETESGEKVWRIGVGVVEQIPPDVLKQLQFTQRFGLIDGFVKAVDETRQMTVMSFKLIGRLITGDVSLSNISGPVTIARYSGEAAKTGLISFLSFLAIISISLGLLNLLPIPMLDGGHLLYYIIEMIKGSPVSQQVEDVGMRIGMAAIGCLMVLAFYNDIMRLIK